MYTGVIEDLRRLLINEGHRLRLPQQRHQLHPSDPAAAIPAAAWAPLDALLAAAQRLAPGLRPAAAELAEGLQAARDAAVGNTGAFALGWARRREREEGRLAAELEAFYAVHNPAKASAVREIAECYVDRQARARAAAAPLVWEN